MKITSDQELLLQKNQSQFLRSDESAIAHKKSEPIKVARSN